MKKRLLLLLTAFASPAAASIPPVGWQGPRWEGPGLLCRSSFTFALLEGETAEQQYPSVGYIRFTVRSGNGIFEVAEDWYRRVPEDKVLLKTVPEGGAFKLTGQGYGRTYFYLPSGGGLPFELHFDPLSGHPSSFTGDAEQTVIDRLDFNSGERENCLNEPE